ncbi:MAG TPA: polysaccharide deacetylase family protein [Terracidiphilus sp.]|nr:polysaccharide deacetylase family protein [Terracidiphilus sp.]
MLSALATDICAGLGVAGAAALAAGGFAYASQWPGSRIFGTALTAPQRPGEIALTFDDGPNPAWTPRLLDTLAKHEVKATFFMLGKFAEEQKELVRRVAAEGHLIGNHTWTHPKLSTSSASRIEGELRLTKEVLEQIVGARVKLFRPPFGARRPAVFRIARELGLEPVLWNAMTNDWDEPPAEKIASTLSRRVDALKNRGYAANIVLHDGNYREAVGRRGPSVTAAGMILEHYKAGAKFVTLESWR